MILNVLVLAAVAAAIAHLSALSVWVSVLSFALKLVSLIALVLGACLAVRHLRARFHQRK